jgi:hypothetical protein
MLDPDDMSDRESLRAMCPLFQSDKLDDGEARRELMLQAITHDRVGYSVREEPRLVAVRQ